MKQTILIIALLIVVANNAFSQFTVGPKAGLNLTKEYAGQKMFDEHQNSKTGLNLGLFGCYEMNDKLDLQVEMLYSQQGYKTDIALIDWNGEMMTSVKASSHYLNVPLLLKYYPFKRFYIEAGPQIGFCLDSSFLSENDEMNGVLKEMDADYHKVDFSLAGGLGFHIGKGFSINVRYNHGFTKTLNESLWKNRVIQFSLAYDLWSF